MMRLGTDRLRLRRVDGLEHVRLLGTGEGAASASGSDLRRSAMFAVWRDEAALDAFVASGPLADRWSRAEESWHVRLRLISGDGTWRGEQPMDGFEHVAAEGPIVVVTRATVRPRVTREFRMAAADTNADVVDAPGLRAVVGFGERPIGRLGTFSVWESSAAADAFAAGHAHQRAVAHARAGKWFGEELFARFAPFGEVGSWNGLSRLTV